MTRLYKPEEDSEDVRFFGGQKSNGAYAATNMLMRFYSTYDPAYAKRMCPFMTEIVNCWEDYLIFENGRYNICNDSVHEGSGPDMNGILSLGLVRMVFKGMIDLSTEMGVDADRRTKWRHILDHMPDYPLQERNGMTVFRYSEKGMAWCDSNTLGIQHIWPAEQIGLDSGEKMLKISRDTVTGLSRWDDGNGFPTFYRAAVRVGYDPSVILKNLRGQCETRSKLNLFIYHGGGGIEDCSTVPSCINEMLMQSHEGVIRFFPVWPKTMGARFGTLRAYGAFLVSSALKDGKVQYAIIKSEKGRQCTVQNPWPGKIIVVRRNGNPAEELSGDRFTFETGVGENRAFAEINANRTVQDAGHRLRRKPTTRFEILTAFLCVTALGCSHVRHGGRSWVPPMGTNGMRLLGCWYDGSRFLAEGECSDGALHAQTTDDLERAFLAPPDSARPWVIWFWLNGNVTKEGITADLEAMHKVGLGGALWMWGGGVGGDVHGPVKLMDPQWWELMRHTVREADRLGLKINLTNGSGWSHSGGPWVKPEHSMQRLELGGEFRLRGPARWEAAKEARGA